MSEQESAPAVEAPAVEAAASTYERKPLNPDLVAKFVAQRKAERENTEFVPAFEQETNAPAPAVATPPPAPSGPPPEAIAAWEKANLRAAELERREAALREREEKLRDVSERFSEKPWETLVDVVRANLGNDATQDDIDREMQYQLYQLNLKQTGIEVDKNNPAHDLRRLDRELRLTKAQARKAQEVAKAEREAATKAGEERARQEQVFEAQKLVGKAYQELAPQFRYLSAAHSDPAELITQYVLEEHARTGQIVEIADAAKALDAHFERMFKPLTEKLSSPPTSNGQQGAPPAQRPRSLTNADASEGGTQARYKMDEFGQPPPLEQRVRDSWERVMSRRDV